VTELDQVKSELKEVQGSLNAVMGLLESVVGRLDRSDVAQGEPTIYEVGCEMSPETINREISRGNRRPLHEQNKRRLQALKKITIRSS